jgi:hypothetical protein
VLPAQLAPPLRCGSCSSACPSGAAHRRQIHQQRELTGSAQQSLTEARSSIHSCSEHSCIGMCSSRRPDVLRSLPSCALPFHCSSCCRHGEFLRHIKREYARLVALLQAYALIRCRALIQLAAAATAAFPPEDTCCTCIVRAQFRHHTAQLEGS